MFVKVPHKSRADSGQQGGQIVLRWNSFVHKSCSHHTLHMHSHPRQGGGTTQPDIAAVHTRLHLSVRIIKKMRSRKGKRVIDWNEARSFFFSLSMCSLDTLPLLLERSVHQHKSNHGNGNLRTEWNSYTLLYLMWTVSRCELFTVTERAATGVYDWVRTEGWWTRLL